MITKNASNNGIFLATILVAASFSFYLANTKMFLQTKSELLFIPFILLIFKTGADAKTLNKGFIDFNTLFKDMFFVAAFGTLISTIFDFVLFNMINPELKPDMFTYLTEFYEDNGWSELAPYANTLEKIESGEYFTLKSTLVLYLKKLLVPCAFVSAIFAGLLRRKMKNQA